MKKNIIFRGLAVTLILLTAIAYFNGRGTCRYTIEGKLEVKSRIEPAVGQKVALAEVPVRFSGSGFSASRDKTMTDRDGNYRFEKIMSGRSCNAT